MAGECHKWLPCSGSDVSSKTEDVFRHVSTPGCHRPVIPRSSPDQYVTNGTRVCKLESKQGIMIG